VKFICSDNLKSIQEYLNFIRSLSQLHLIHLQLRETLSEAYMFGQFEIYSGIFQLY
jgi:hypothetical protein